MTKRANNGSIEVLVSILTAAVISVIAILIFATVLTFADIGGQTVDIIVTVIKVVAVLIGILVGVRSGRGGAVKGMITGMVYALLCYGASAVSSGDYIPRISFWIDSAIIMLAALIAGIVVVNIAGR